VRRQQAGDAQRRQGWDNGAIIASSCFRVRSAQGLSLDAHSAKRGLASPVFLRVYPHYSDGDFHLGLNAAQIPGAPYPISLQTEIVRLNLRAPV